MDTALNRLYRLLVVSFERMEEPLDDAGEQYRRYLARFDARYGRDRSVGEYFRGAGAFKKLSYDKFEARWQEALEIRSAWPECERELIEKHAEVSIYLRLIRSMQERLRELLLDDK